METKNVKGPLTEGRIKGGVKPQGGIDIRPILAPPPPKSRVEIARTPMELLFDMKDVKTKYALLKAQHKAWMEHFDSDAYDANQLLLKHMELEKELATMTKCRDFHQHDAVGLRDYVGELENELDNWERENR